MSLRGLRCAVDRAKRDQVLRNKRENESDASAEYGIAMKQTSNQAPRTFGRSVELLPIRYDVAFVRECGRELRWVRLNPDALV